jgi:hypothetical protein
MRVVFSDSQYVLPSKCLLTCQNECLAVIQSWNKEESLMMRKVGILSYRSEKEQTEVLCYDIMCQSSPIKIRQFFVFIKFSTGPDETEECFLQDLRFLLW